MVEKANTEKDNKDLCLYSKSAKKSLRGFKQDHSTIHNVSHYELARMLMCVN